MSGQELGAAGVMLWMIVLAMLAMSASAQVQDRASFLERAVWKVSRKQAARAARRLRRLLDGQGIVLSRQAWALVCRDGVLAAASTSAWLVQYVLVVVLTMPASIALAVRVLGLSDLGVWRESLAVYAGFAVLTGSVAVLLALADFSRRRWTSCFLTHSAATALAAAVGEPETLGDLGRYRFTPRGAHTARQLGALAASLEVYAVHRARPCGADRTSQALTCFTAAAEKTRELADAVVLDGPAGRRRAAREVASMIEAMSTGDYRRLAPRGNGSVEPLLRHQRRRARQRGVLLAALATASIGGLVVAAAGTAIAPAVAGSVAAVLLTVWLRLLKLQPDAAPDTEQPAPARQRVSN